MHATTAPVEGPIDILFYATGDAGGALGTAYEEHDIRAALHQGGGRFNVRVVDQPDLAHLDSFLDGARVLHLSAHGTEDGRIHAEGPFGTYRVSGEALARILAGRGLDLVVLSVCSAQAAAEAIAPHVGCVVAADARVSFRTMSYFNHGFYECLARGGTVGEAFDAGRARAEMGAGSTEHLHLIGDSHRRLVPPPPPRPVEADARWDVCIVASPTLASVCRRMAAHLQPHRTIYLGASDDPTAFVDEIDRGLAEARVVMVLYEAGVYGEVDGEPITEQRAEALWDLRDWVIGAVAERIADTDKRLFPVYLDGRPPRRRIYPGLRRLHGLDIEARGGLARAMREIERMFLAADAAITPR